MPATLLSAPTGSSLSALLLPHLAQAMRAHTRVWYLAPSAGVRNRRIRALAHRMPLLAPPIGTVEDFAREALHAAGRTIPEPADELAVELILRDLIAKALPTATHRPGTGLARAALRAIDTLLADGYRCDSLPFPASSSPPSPVAAPAASELAPARGEVWTEDASPPPARELRIAALWRALHALCPDADWAAPMRELLTGHLIEHAAPELLLIEGSPLTGELSARIVSALIRTVMARGGRVIAALPDVPPGRGRIARAAAFLHEQMGVAPTPVQGDMDGAAPAIRHIADHLFRTDLQPFALRAARVQERPAHVLTLHAPDAHSTAELVAREIIALMGDSRDGWAALDRGVVVVCPTRDDRRLVERALRRHDIPVAAVPREPMHAHPGGRYLLALLTVLELGPAAPLDAVLALLGSDGWALDRREAARLEAQLIRAGATCARDALAELRTGRAHRRLRRVLALAGALAATSDMSEYVHLVRCAIHPRLARAEHRTCDPVRGAWERHSAIAIADGHRPTARVRAVAGYARPMRRLDDLMRTLAERARRTEAHPTFADWARDLRALMMNTELQIGSAPARGVRLEPPGAIEPAQIVVVLGLVEKRFPRAPRQDPFLPDDMRQALGTHFLVAPRTAADVGDMERERFLLSCAAARRQLYLCSPKMDDDGRELLPSMFVEDVQRCLGGGRLTPLEERAVHIGSAIPDLEWADGAPELRAAVAAALHDAALPESRRPRVARAFDALSARDARFRERLIASMPDYHARVSRDESVVYLRTHAARLSHSQIDAYGHCAFQHFVEKRLKPAALELPRFDALAQGGVAHRWLWEFAARDGGWSDGGGARFDQAVAALAAREVPATPASRFAPQRSAADWELLKRRTIELLHRERERLASTPFKPVYHELAFGMSRGHAALDDSGHDAASLPDPLPLRFGEHIIRLTGRIDRVDIVERRGRRFGIAIDYKLGSVDRYVAALRRNEELQLFLYLRAMLAWDIVPVGALYLSIHENEMAGLLLDEYAGQLGTIGERVTTVTRAEWRRLRHAANAEVARRHARMQQGIIEARPRDWDCGYCELSDVCRIDLWKARADG
ncbi:MAG TPA: PD-(D/E)XK nuclease family protein [Gemmatimonadaceae bacterium]|nr:PD-(D/E)XK nuclease family protein [Gemmatimonadaceae bacterium]